MYKASIRFLLASAICFCATSLFLSRPLQAQTTFGTVTGTVTDSTGAAISGAQAVLTSKATGAAQTVTTGADGLYDLVNVLPGEYRLDVDKAGFKHFLRDPVVVEVQQSIRIDVPMEVGQQAQTVTVTAETPLLQSTTTSLGQSLVGCTPFTRSLAWGSPSRSTPTPCRSSCAAQACASNEKSRSRCCSEELSLGCIELT